MSYTRVNWQDAPSVSTPLSASNLNKMDAGIKQNADDIEQLQQHTYDAELNNTSTNAPQTKAVYEALRELDIETDTTLSVSGKAADAAATGEAVNQVKNALEVVEDAALIHETYTGAWYIGGITSQGSLNTTFKYSVRTSGEAYSVPVDGTITCISGYQVRVVWYSQKNIGASAFVSDSGWTSNPIPVSAGDLIAICIKEGTGTSIIQSDTSIKQYVVFNLYSDKVAMNKALADAEFKEIEDAIFYDYVPSVRWYIGGITSQGSLNTTFKYCVRSSGVAVQFPVGGVIRCDSGFDIRIVRYSQKTIGKSTFVSDSGWTTEPQAISAYEFIAICIMNHNDTTTVLTDTSIVNHIIFDFKLTVFPAYQKSVYYRSIAVSPFEYSDWYETVQTFTEGFNENTKYADIISAFDALVSNSGGYLTKTDLGTITSADSLGNPYHIYCYTFKAKRYGGDYANSITPKILLGCTAHGFEKNATYATYYLIKDILTNWNDSAILTAFRHGVEIQIIPVVNPWGFDHNDRLNENGVNINRNYYNPQWSSGESGTSDYGGTEPFSEDESRIVRDWVLSNKDAVCVLDVHTNGQYNADGYGEANALMPVNGVNDVYYDLLYDVCRAIINDQTIRLPYEIAALSGIPYSAFIGKIQSDPITQTRGTMQLWVTLQGILSMTFEVFNGLNAGGSNLITKFTNDSFKCVTEILGNGLAKIIREYAGK